MAQVLSLKELRSSSALKAEISRLEEEKNQLLEQLEREKLLEKKLHDDILVQKKDFEHLEKQFDHFAGIEAELEALQQQVQMDKLEQLVEGDRKEIQVKAQIKKLKDELKEAQDELRDLKKLDPQRLKRQVSDLKKKTQQQATDNQNINNALVAARKELKETTLEKDKLEAELKASRTGTDFFWQSADGNWKLFETPVVLADEKIEDEANFKRIRCLQTATGMSVLSNGRDDKDRATWLGTLEIPEDVALEAGKRLLSIAAELEEDASAK